MHSYKYSTGKKKKPTEPEASGGRLLLILMRGGGGGAGETIPGETLGLIPDAASFSPRVFLVMN